MSHVDPFNAPGGFSVGIPPELVIDETGNVVNNVNAPNSNVTANRVFANAYLYANGQPLSIGASGSNTQVQYNNNGLLGASSAFTFNSATNLLTVTKLQVGSNANLGNVSNVVILGGTNGYFLQTDGAGNLTWAPAGNGGGGGNGNPGGANTQVQFNDAGNFAGDAGFTFNKVTNILSVPEFSTGNIAANYIVTNWDVTANVVDANYLYGDGSNITNVHAVLADVANEVAGSNVTGQVNFAAVANSVAGANVTGQVAFANVANNVAGANITGQVANALVAGTVYTSAQPNITSVGNLTSLTVVGNTTLGNQVVSNYFIGNLFGTANLARNVTFAAQPNITSVGTLTSLTVSGDTTLGNSVTANYFTGRLYGVANSAIVANTANVATIANTATYANTAGLSNNSFYSNFANFANVAYNIDGSNVSGQVANALVAGTVYTNAQPNITSLGTLSSLSVTGNITAGNITSNFIGSGAQLSGIPGANISGAVANATYAVTAGTANSSGNATSAINAAALLQNTSTATSVYPTFTTSSANGNSQAVFNTSISANLANASITATTFVGTLVGTASNASTAGTVTTSAQPNITSVGTLVGLNVNGNIVATNFTANTGVFTGNGSGLSSITGANVTGTVANATTSGTVITAAQPNITSVGTLTSLAVTGNASAGNVTSNFIGNGSRLSNLTAANITGVVANANYASFAGIANTSNVSLHSNTANTVVDNAQPNITSVGTLTSLAVTGNASAGNVTSNFIGNGSKLSNLTGANVTGTVANANYASFAGTANTTNVSLHSNTANTVVDNAQPNITSVGNLISLVVLGNITASNVTANFIGNGSRLSNLTAANITGVVANANYASFANIATTANSATLALTANTVTDAAQPNITSVGNLSSLVVTGNTTSGNVYANSGTVRANILVGTISTISASQPNITTIGTLNALSVTGNITSGNISAGNLISANYISGILTTNSQQNINYLGNVGWLNVDTAVPNSNGNIRFNGSMSGVGAASNIDITGNIIAGNFVQANLLIGVLTTNAQPNVTSLGNLTTLTVVGQSNLGNVANITIEGGSSGYVLSTDGIGNLSWIAQSNGGSNTDPGGANTEIQFNDNGVFGGSSSFTWNKVTNYLFVGGNANFSGRITAPTIYSNVANGTAPFVVNSVTPVANLAVETAGTVRNSAQPNITSVGNLTSLVVLGNTTSPNIFAERIEGSLTTNAQPNITSVGTLTSLSVSGLSNLGSVSNLKVSGGTNGYVLSTDGTGNLSWVAQSGGGGNGSPGGSNTQIQFNNAGLFDGSPRFTWNDTSNLLLVTGNATITGTLNANSFVTNSISSNSTIISGNITAGNVNGGNLVSANYLSGTLITANQPNINYLGNLGWLNVDTGIAGGNGNIRFNGSISGVGAYSNIVITGNLNAGNYVQADLLIGTITTSSQPNITSLGNLTGLNVVGESNLGNVANLTITGGSANYVLSTDGAGNLSWVAQSGGGNGTPGGTNTYVQFNDGNTFGGDNSFTWNKNTNNLFVGGNIFVSNVVTSSVLVSNIATGSAPLVVTSTTPVANLAVDTANTVRSSSQPNITSLGTLTSLAVSGNTTTGNLSVSNTFAAANITTPGTVGTTNLSVSGSANFSANANITGSGTLFVNGKLNTANSSNVWLGNVGNVHISGGFNGYVLATDGNANLYWTAQGGGGGNTTPGGSNTQIQFNNNGVFAGAPAFTFDVANSNVTVAGNLIANTVTIGSGAYEFSQSNVYFATTNSTSEQILLSIPVQDVAAVDYTIISTDGNIRNFIKISTVVIGSSLNYVEYSTLPVNGYTGDFSVNYFAGNIYSPAAIQLKITPQTANLMSHKMMITTYKE